MDKKLSSKIESNSGTEPREINSKEPSFSFHEAHSCIIYRIYGVQESVKLINAYGTRTMRKELSIECVGLYYGKFQRHQDTQNI